jgi:hypothetical protein
MHRPHPSAGASFDAAGQLHHDRINLHSNGAEHNLDSALDDPHDDEDRMCFDAGGPGSGSRKEAGGPSSSSSSSLEVMSAIGGAFPMDDDFATAHSSSSSFDLGYPNFAFGSSQAVPSSTLEDDATSSVIIDHYLPQFSTSSPTTLPSSSSSPSSYRRPVSIGSSDQAQPLPGTSSTTTTTTTTTATANRANAEQRWGEAALQGSSDDDHDDHEAKEIIDRLYVAASASTCPSPAWFKRHGCGSILRVATAASVSTTAAAASPGPGEQAESTQLLEDGSRISSRTVVVVLPPPRMDRSGERASTSSLEESSSSSLRNAADVVRKALESRSSVLLHGDGGGAAAGDESESVEGEGEGREVVAATAMAYLVLGAKLSLRVAVEQLVSVLGANTVQRMADGFKRQLMAIESQVRPPSYDFFALSRPATTTVPASTPTQYNLTTVYILTIHCLPCLTMHANVGLAPPSRPKGSTTSTFGHGDDQD